MKRNLEVSAATRLSRTLIVTALAVGFAAGFAVLTASAEVSDGAGSAEHGANGGEAAHTCPHAKAAADGAAAASCDHAADGSCASCADAKDCPHAKDGSCSECGGKEAAPETH